MSLSASALVAGVTGEPIRHSLSPAIHTAWLAAAGVEAAYRAFPAKDEAAFDHLIAGGRRGVLRGLNITAPWKGRAAALADEADAVVEATGSANLLVFEDGRVRAFSTDGIGVIAALEEQAPSFDLRGAEVLMLGAGGAARAVVPALLDAGAAKIVVRNRTAANAEALAAAFDGRVVAETAGEGADAGLVINAVAGDPAHDFAGTSQAVAALDMTYRPLKTPFLVAAERAGAAPVDGLAMLIGQARPSFERLFGQAPPEIDIRRIAIAAMEARA